MRLVLSSIAWGFVLVLAGLMLAIASPFILFFIIRCIVLREDPREYVQRWTCINGLRTEQKPAQ